MIKINNQAYTAVGSNNDLATTVLRLNEMTDEQVVKFSTTEDFTGTSVEEIKALLHDMNIILPDRVILLSIGLLRDGQPDNFIVYVNDILEKFPRGIPTITRVIYDIYPEGFYTQKALNKRIDWMKKYKDELRHPEIVKYLK